MKREQLNKLYLFVGAIARRLESFCRWGNYCTAVGEFDVRISIKITSVANNNIIFALNTPSRKVEIIVFIENFQLSVDSMKIVRRQMNERKNKRKIPGFGWNIVAAEIEEENTEIKKIMTTTTTSTNVKFHSRLLWCMQEYFSDAKITIALSNVYTVQQTQLDKNGAYFNNNKNTHTSIQRFCVFILIFHCRI